MTAAMLFPSTTCKNIAKASQRLPMTSGLVGTGLSLRTWKLLRLLDPDCDALGPAESMDAKLVEDPTEDCEAGNGCAR